MHAPERAHKRRSSRSRRAPRAALPARRLAGTNQSSWCTFRFAAGRGGYCRCVHSRSRRHVPFLVAYPLLFGYTIGHSRGVATGLLAGVLALVVPLGQMSAGSQRVRDLDDTHPVGSTLALLAMCTLYLGFVLALLSDAPLASCFGLAACLSAFMCSLSYVWFHGRRSGLS